MKLDRNELSKAVRMALSMSAVAAVGAVGTAYAQDQGATQGQGNNQQPQTLQTIVVTGSHIRRVDLETSNPVVAVSAQQIQATGKATIGDIVQQLPVITGGVENPNVNNGGGSGSTNVGLRGLGASRTLILVDGQRLVGFQGLVDLNFIPTSAVERIEVLTDGASAVYGSDAIGGVINIILKDNYQGAEFTGNYGISDHDDAGREGGTFMFGESSDKGSILAGVEYQKSDDLLQSSRDFSKDSVSLSTSGGVPFASVGGSTFAARDRIDVPDQNAAFGCAGGGALSLNQGTASSGTSPTGPGDYHCFGNSDKYNYASVNLIMTPAERTNAFFKGTYHLTDNIDFSATFLHQKAVTEAQLAPAVLGTLTGLNISADSYYNPFHENFAYGSSKGNDFRTRLFPVGNRQFHNATTKDQVNTLLKGNFNIGDQNWTWDVGYNYGHISRILTNLGFPNLAQLNAGTGPSMLDPSTGQVVCVGTPGDLSTEIAGCTPFDVFNQFNPATQAAEAATAAATTVNTYYISKTSHADISGGLFDLPAGTVQLAAGVDYNKQYTNNTVDPEVLIEDFPPYSCSLGSACASHLQGGFNVKEAYAEMFIPILKDMPAFQSLNITLGDRYSKYNTVGGTNNWKVGLEWKPIDDLLLRGTATSVFRAPSINQLYGSPVSSAPRLSYDPCTGYTGAPAGSGPATACQNVPTDGSYVDYYTYTGQQLTAINGGAQFFGVNLKPESGKTFDLGAVYSPHYVPGLSLSADLWRVYINNTIATVGVQTSLLECYNGVMSFCPNVDNRTAGGDPGVWTQPIANLGRIDVKGIDFAANYKLPQFSFGQFDVGLQGTYLDHYTINTAPGTAGTLVLNGVGNMGTFGSALGSSCPFPAGGLCFFPRVRATATLGWQLGPWDAQWTMRYMSGFNGGSADPSQYSTMCLGFGQGSLTEPPCVIHYGATTYNNLQLGYNIEPINTRIDVGVDNVFDKQPPFLYANNSLNANTDPEDFDVIGRYYWGRVTVKF
ncbi:MAG TPA: TonB-dependent receptor [Rhodanobacteraceae bacterium]|nr:TonB-dependent receptor [Rhodanobacteraceae bacterium]